MSKTLLKSIGTVDIYVTDTGRFAATFDNGKGGKQEHTADKLVSLEQQIQRYVLRAQEAATGEAVKVIPAPVAGSVGPENANRSYRWDPDDKEPRWVMKGTLGDARVTTFVGFDVATTRPYRGASPESVIKLLTDDKRLESISEHGRYALYNADLIAEWDAQLAVMLDQWKAGQEVLRAIEARFARVNGTQVAALLRGEAIDIP